MLEISAVQTVYLHSVVIGQCLWYLVSQLCWLLQESSVVTRLMAVLVGFMVDDQLSSLAAGKDDLTNKVSKLKCSISPSTFY